jgi:antitoxin CptB
MNADMARLRWRCRRGMRELDQLLGWYLDARYAEASAEGRIAFCELLEQQDPQLWDWLSGRSVPECSAWRAVIDEIRARDHV